MYNMTPYCKNIRNSSSFVSFQDHFWGIRGYKMCHPSQQYFNLHHDHYHHHQDRLPRNCMNILYNSHNNHRTKIAGSIQKISNEKSTKPQNYPYMVGKQVLQFCMKIQSLKHTFEWSKNILSAIQFQSLIYRTFSLSFS